MAEVSLPLAEMIFKFCAQTARQRERGLFKQISFQLETRDQSSGHNCNLVNFCQSVKSKLCQAGLSEVELGDKHVS